MGKLTAVIILIFLKLILCAQVKILHAEAKPFVPLNYEILDYRSGDINGDKIEDALLILKIIGEDSADEESKRPLLILIRQPDGKLKLAFRNDNVIMCRHCGGAFGDPYEAATIENNGFSLNFYGGSSWRWGYNYTFTYQKADKNWYLSKEKQISFQAGDPEMTLKEIVIEQVELGKVPFQKFNINPPYQEVKWKVTAAKTYFYDTPKLGSKPRKGYLLKDNQAVQIRELKNFIELNFENTKGQFTSGFLLKKELQKMN